MMDFCFARTILVMDDDLIDLCDIKVRHVLPLDITPSLFCKGT